MHVPACASARRLHATFLRQMLGMVIAGALDTPSITPDLLHLISAMSARQAMVTWQCVCLLGKLVMVTWNPWAWSHGIHMCYMVTTSQVS